MNIRQAKQLSLIDVMGELGHTPHREAKGEVWYLSPFRQETQPSFKINCAKNLWYDFGEGQGGNIIDFIVKLEGDITVSNALKRLAELTGGPTTKPSIKPQPRAGIIGGPIVNTFKPEPTPRRAGASLQIRQIKKLQNPSLVSYIGERGISVETARPYLQEIHYTANRKPYFALLFTNDSGGYELRNPYYKGSYGTKDITTIEGTAPPGSELAVFEGFMNFLSAKTFYQDSFTQPALVLNSVAMKEKAVEAIRRAEVQAVSLYLDHDDSGRAVRDYFEQQLQCVATITDKSDLYEGYNDFNDFLIATRYEASPFSFR